MPNVNTVESIITFCKKAPELWRELSDFQNLF